MNELTSNMAAVEMGGEEAEMASKNILKCVQVLRNYQDEANEVKKAYLEELVSLERKYQGLFQPIYDKRASIISGAEAPSLTEKEKEDIPEDAPDGDERKGVPGFWLQALGQHPEIHPYIEEEDIPLLQEIKDITITYSFDYSEFTVNFFFNENDFMTETELKKTYTVTPSIVDDEANVAKVEGTEIHWKPGKDLTVKEVKKKQKGKGGKNKGQTRTITKLENKHSFFLYFSQPRDDDDDEDEDDEDEDYKPKPGFDATSDYDVAHSIRTQIIPEALYWFTGENVEDSDDSDYDDDDDDDEEDDDEDEGPGLEKRDEDEDEEEDFKPRTNRRGKGKNKAPVPAFTFDPNAPPPAPGADGDKQECKQS